MGAHLSKFKSFRIGRLAISDPFFSTVVFHGPKTWPWWRLVSFSFVRCGRTSDTSYPRTYRLWVYFRWGRMPSYGTWAKDLGPLMCPAAALDFVVYPRN
jgi:hypothetical protein